VPVAVESFNAKSLSESAIEYSWRSDSRRIHQIGRYLDHFDTVASTEFANRLFHLSETETGKPKSPSALQFLDFGVVWKDFFDDSNKIASHWIEIRQTIDRTRLVITAIKDVKHVAIETERDLNCAVSGTESKQNAIIRKAAFHVRALVIGGRPLEKAL
jgi:hypothetical protein